MNFLGMGPGELVLIIIIALIVLGPGKLPEVARALGKTMREFRSITDTFQNELRKEIDTASSPVKDDVQSIKKTLASTAESVTSAAQSAAVTSNAESVPDDSFAEHYQNAQGGGGETAETEGEEGEKGQLQTTATQSEEAEISSSAQDDDQPVEYAAPAAVSEGPETRD